MSSARILIIEDDKSLAEILAYNLREAGYDVSIASDGQQGLRSARNLNPDLIVLDLMLPMVDGVEVCRRLRAESSTSKTLILMLTAKSEETDEVVGFAVGADDYVTKPFSVKALRERIKALLRRRELTVDQTDVVIHQDLMIDRRRHVASLANEPLELTPTEFSLLDALARQPGRAFSRTDLIDAAIGEDAVVLDRTIDVHIRSLRKKLGAHAEVIQTVRGVGYRFREIGSS